MRPSSATTKKTCASLATIHEVGLLVQNPPTLIFLTSLTGHM
jgi:hypothetical protein